MTSPRLLHAADITQPLATDDADVESSVEHNHDSLLDITIAARKERTNESPEEPISRLMVTASPRSERKRSDQPRIALSCVYPLYIIAQLQVWSTLPYTLGRPQMLEGFRLNPLVP